MFNQINLLCFNRFNIITRCNNMMFFLRTSSLTFSFIIVCLFYRFLSSKFCLLCCFLFSKFCLFCCFLLSNFCLLCCFLFSKFYLLCCFLLSKFCLLCCFLLSKFCLLCCFLISKFLFFYGLFSIAICNNFFFFYLNTC